MTTYPASIDNSSTLPTAVDNSTPVQGAVVNRLRDAVLAIEAELGVKPSSVYGTVRARLDALEGIIGNLQIIELNKDLGGTLEEPLVIGIQGRPVSSVAPTNGQSLVWNGIAWAPRTISGGGGGGTQDLFTTLSLGNVTDGYDIIVSAGDKITITDGPVSGTDAVNKAYVDGYSGSSRDLTNTLYVDLGGTGAGNIEDPYGSVTDALAELNKLVIIAPGDYSDEPDISVVSNRKYYISGMNYPGVGSPFEGNFITTLPGLVMPGTGGEQGAMTLSNLNLINGVELASSTRINNCVNVSVGPATNLEATFLEISDSHIASLNVAGLNATGCTFAFDIAISVSGTSATIISSQFSGNPTIIFTADPGILYIDESSNYTNIQVTNGTKVILESAGGGSQTLKQTLALGNITDGYDIIVSAGDVITITDAPVNPTDGVNKFYVDGYFFGGDGYGTGNPGSGNIVVTTLTAGHPAGRYEVTAYAEIVTATSAGTVDASIGYTSAALGAKTMEMFPNPQSLTPTGPLNWFSTTIYSNGTAAITVTFTMASVIGSGRIDCYTAARKF